jgi:hypothetical protein
VHFHPGGWGGLHILDEHYMNQGKGGSKIGYYYAFCITSSLYFLTLKGRHHGRKKPVAASQQNAIEVYRTCHFMAQKLIDLVASIRNRACTGPVLALDRTWRSRG